MRLGPARRPVTLNSNIARQQDRRRAHGFRLELWVVNRANPFIKGVFLQNGHVIANHHTGKTINRLTRAIAGKFNIATLVLRHKNRPGWAINTLPNRVNQANQHVDTRTLNTNLPVRVLITMRDRLASLRSAPLIFKGARTNVNGIRINTTVRVDHTIRNTTVAKRPRLRTRVPTSDATTLKLRGGVLVHNVRFRYLDRRVNNHMWNLFSVTSVRPGPSRVPISFHNNVPREEDNRDVNCNGVLA